MSINQYQNQNECHPVKAILVASLLAGACEAQQENWSFDDSYGDDLNFLHTVANYEFHPVWQESWENGLFNSNMIRLNYASVSQTELLSDARLTINERLNRRIWVRYATVNLATQFNDEGLDTHSVGLEAILYKGLSVFVYGNPQFDKSQISVQYGISWTNASRNQYVRVSWVDIEPFWDDKNDQNSANTSDPWALVWELNWRFDRLRLFSEGRYEGGTERTFAAPPDDEELRFEASKRDDILVKAYYYVSPIAFVELSWSHYRFNENRLFTDIARDYDFNNRIDIFKAGYITPVAGRYRARFGTHVVEQNASATGFGEHDYQRREIIPYIFWEWFIGPGALETGYMGTFQRWDYEGDFTIRRPSEEGYTDKVQLAYTFDFSGRSFLKISVSQMASFSGFGGGNVQFFMDF